MPVDVLMPQMGESVTEGTVTKWLKKEGDSIGKDEPLFEISTDKVDAEIPAPAAGVLAKIMVSEGQTVSVHSVVAQIESSSGESQESQGTKQPAAKPTAKAATSAPSAEGKAAAQEPEVGKGKAAAKDAEKKSTGAGQEPQPTNQPAKVSAKEASPVELAADQEEGSDSDQESSPQAGKENKNAAKVAAPAAGSPKTAVSRPGPVAVGAQTGAAEPLSNEKAGEQENQGEQVRSSPLVRRLAAEHNVDISQVEGTGLGGRVTKEDLLAFVENQGKKGTETGGEATQRESTPVAEFPSREESVPMSAMRKKIAEHMVLSRHTSAHVTTVFTVDFTRIVDIYHREKGRFEHDENTRLGYTPFFIRSVIDGLKRFPIINSSLVGDNIVYK